MIEKSLVVHVIAGLGNGGAERTLYNLCSRDKKYRHHVISLTDEGVYGERLRAAGISVTALGMRAAMLSPAPLCFLWFHLRRLKPEILQTWMYHADLIGGLVGRLAGIRRIFWNIRQTSLGSDSLKQSTLRVARICAFVSKRVPVGIVCCAYKAQRAHAAFGYDAVRMTVVHNGCDASELHAEAEDVRVLRHELRLEAHVPILGMVARFAPVKDHRGFLAALRLLKEEQHKFQVMLIGPEMTCERPEIAAMLREFDLVDRVKAIGPRTDIAAIYGSLDLHVLSSLSEGFPNVLAEAMSCGTPCVATDVGDAAEIVGDTGWIVPPADAGALAQALRAALVAFQDRESWLRRQSHARMRIKENFSMERMVAKYDAIWSAP